MVESYKEIAYKLLKDRILSCQLRPNDVIDPQEIEKELGISRTPVREALAALEQENLVTIFPRRGIVVSGISAEEITNITITRRLIEPYLAGNAVKFADSAVLRDFLKKFSSDEDFLTSTRADYEFHLYLAQCSKNNYLIHVMNLVLANNMRLVILAARLPNRLKLSNAEHCSIIHALLERDGAKAERLMTEHLISAAQSSYDSTQNPSIF